MSNPTRQLAAAGATAVASEDGAALASAFPPRPQRRSALIEALRQSGERASPPPDAHSVRHVTLVRPAMVSSSGTWSSPITPPLGLAYLAAMLRESGIEVAVVEGMAEGIEQFIEEDGYVYQGLTIPETIDRIDPSTQLIGISCMFSQDWPWTCDMIRAIRARFPYIPIVAGGEHITALPEYSLRDCPELDFCVLGEGEETLVDLANHLYVDGRGVSAPSRAYAHVAGLAFLEEGRFVQTEPRKRIRAVDEIPLPAWDLFPMSVYLDCRNAHGVYLGRTMGILATRGCPYKCTFCSNPVMYGNLWMPRSPADVLDEIESYIRDYQATNIDFYDLTFILRRTWILEFCRLIVERGLKFTWQLPTGTRSEVIDGEVSAALFRTGCRNITYAPESGSAETLEAIKKQVDLNRVTDSIRAALNEGIHVKINIIIGFPHERRRHVLQTIWFCWKMAVLGVHDAGIFLFSPYPGSQLFEELRQEGKIPALDQAYFRSLVAFMDPFAPSEYCRHVHGHELSFWRFFGMASFFAVSYLCRPWRAVKLIKSIWKNEGDTVLEQRLGAIIHRPAPKHISTRSEKQPAAAAP